MIGKRIKQARLLAGLTQDELVQRLANYGYRITKAGISKYENNKSVAPAPFLLAAAVVLNVPSTYFQHETVTDVQWLAFRRHSQLPKQRQQAVKAYATDITELQLELQDLLYPMSAPTIPATQSVQTFEQAEDMALALRQAWQLDVHPVDSLVQTAEDHQVVVIAWQADDGQFDGLSGWCGERPVTVMNTTVDIDRRRFSLAHEIGHLLMDTTEVSDKEAEKLAHRFAAAFLVPKERAYYELGTTRKQLDLEELKLLKRKYGLSMAAWIYRAKDLGIITEHHASTLYKELSMRGWRKHEPVDFISDEEPLQLRQMIRHALAEGLMAPDRVERVCPECLHDVESPSVESQHLTVYDLLAMPEKERLAVMEEAFARAANDTFEEFEAYGEEDF